MKDPLLVWTTVALILSALICIAQAMLKVTYPVKASLWIFSLGTTLSLFTYKLYGGELKDNINNVIAVGLCWLLTLLVSLFGTFARKEFTRQERRCLKATGWIAAIWGVACLALPQVALGNAIANLSVQILLVVAYWPVIQQVRYSPKKTESVSYWILNSFAGLLALVVALRSRDLLAIIFAGRAFCMGAAVLYFLVRTDLRSEDPRISFRRQKLITIFDDEKSRRKLTVTYNEKG